MPYKNYEDRLRRSREYNEENKDAVRKKHKDWKATNPDKVKANRARYYAGNKEAINARRKARVASNPDKEKERAKEYRKRRPEVFKKTWLKYQYGLTPAEREAMLAAQQYRCAICLSEDPNTKKGWHVDHCHDTGRVRGLLCRRCNVGLGHFKDDTALLEKVVQYIRGTERT